MARRSTPKAKKLRRRNIVVLAILLVLFISLIGAVNLANTETQLLLPERFAERKTIRLDPSANAYDELARAITLIKAPPLPLQVPDPDSPRSKFDYQPDHDSLAQLLGIKRPDDDALTLNYLDDTAEAAAIARNASSIPRFVGPHLPWTPGLRIWSSSDVFYPHTVLRIQLAHAVRQFEFDEDWQDGLMALEECVRLNSMIANSTTGIGMWIQPSNDYRHLQGLYRRVEDPERRAALRQLHARLPLPYPNMQRVLDATLTSIDETLTYPEAHAKKGGRVRFETRVAVFILQRIVNAIRERIPTLRTLANAHPSTFPVLIDAEDWRTMTRWHDRNTIVAHDIVQKLMRAHISNTLHEVTEVSFTIEDYRTEHGAYPETLDALVPEFYDTLPVSPLTGEPLSYERVDEDRGYTIHAESAPLYEYGGEMRYQNTNDYVRYWRHIFD